MMALGERIKQRRAHRGWSQGELARQAGIDPSLLSRIESGATDDPRMFTLMALARALQCSIDHLIGFYDDIPAPHPALAGVAP